MNLIQIVTNISQLCTSHKLLLATAESCTGGMIAKTLTDSAGASEWFYGSVVSYHNEFKKKGLGVCAATLAQYGAVSEEVASQMCHGLKVMGATVALSVTGIAGPTGGTAQKPIGTVCFGFSIHKQTATIVETRLFDGNRHSIRQSATEYALRKINFLLEKA